MSLISIFNNSKIESIYTSSPINKINNDFFLDFFSEEQIKKTIKMIGVESRFWANKNTTAMDLCIESAERMLNENNFDRNDIDGLIFVSQTPNLRMPASSFIAHEILKLKKECAVFDVNLGCSGYVYGLWLANSLIKSGLKKILLLAGETPSKIINLNDPATAFLFGDAGSSTLIGNSDEKFESTFLINTDGSGASTITIPQGINGNYFDIKDLNDPSKLYMDGAKVFNFTIKEIPKIIQQACEKTGRAVSEWDYILLHQANKFMLDHIYKKTNTPKNKQLINIQVFGNTSSVTLPLLLTDKAFDKSKENIMLVGFGVGLSWAAVGLKMNKEIILRHITYES